MEERIREAVTKVVDDVSFSVERPADPARGDYATNASLVAAKELGKNPKEIAEEIVRALKDALGEDAERVEIAGPGFVNITLSRDAIAKELAKAGTEQKGSTAYNGKKILIEYGNPNPFKEMHIGHMMGAIIGEALSRLIESQGGEVKRDTFGGDVGPHVAKALWALQQDGVTEPESAAQIGEAYAKGSKAYEESEDAKKEIDALNQAIYKGDDALLMALWQRGREISMEEFRRIWEKLGTHFDYEFFDSDTTETGLRVVRDGLEKGIFEKSDGAVIYNGEKKGVHTMVFITSHNTPTYEAKDIGLAFLKEERWPSDRIIVITANEQTGRFKTVLAALEEIAPNLAKKTTHIAHGFLRLTSGKMSSREGNVITADDLIADIIKRASEKNEDPLIAEQVAIGAIKYMILRQSPGSDIIFDPEKSLSLEGDSGPYLQYALVRAQSVLAQEPATNDISVPKAPYLLERLIMHYPKVVSRSASELFPNTLASYLAELAGEWNSFYAKERIIGGEHEKHKLFLVRTFASIMQNGLALLGIPTPEKM